MIDKRLTLVSLPSSNKKLTGALADYKDHPFSWWEKKGLRLGVGTDNDVTLNTSFIREMLILLYTDPLELKITKLLIVTTGESRRVAPQSPAVADAQSERGVAVGRRSVWLPMARRTIEPEWNSVDETALGDSEDASVRRYARSAGGTSRCRGRRGCRRTCA